jgi:hypothetical protein
MKVCEAADLLAGALSAQGDGGNISPFGFPPVAQSLFVEGCFDVPDFLG